MTGFIFFVAVFLGLIVFLVLRYAFKLKADLEKIAGGVVTNKDFMDIQARKDYYEISIRESAKIHYGKAKVTKDMIERIEKPYRELYSRYASFPIEKQCDFLNELIKSGRGEDAWIIESIRTVEESVNIALSSKNINTAIGNRQLAIQTANDIFNKYPKAYGLVAESIRILNENYDTNTLENQCTKNFEEAEKLKTAKSKRRRIDNINNLLNEADKNPNISDSVIEFWRNKVKEIK